MIRYTHESTASNQLIWVKLQPLSWLAAALKNQFAFIVPVNSKEERGLSQIHFFCKASSGNIRVAS